MENMSRRPTVVEVAEVAGVSIASVSRVLNGIPARKSTEQKVRAAVAQLGYVPDGTGRALKLGRPLQIVFAVDDVANPVYTQMMRGVEHGVAGAGGRLLVSSTGHAPADLLELVRGLSTGYADGLIISPLRRTPELIDALVATPVPVVVVGDMGKSPPLDTVRSDSRKAIKIAFQHLLESGRSRIAFVNGPIETVPGQTRLQGYQDACAANGVEPHVVQAGAFTVAAGEEAFAALVDETSLDAFDAVLAANDLLALGTMRAALTMGCSVPDALAVVGIDDIEFARIFSPALTTVSLGAERRGALAAELLLDRMVNPSNKPRVASVRPKLVVRESSGTGS
jgi:LacI family transcriptional regulator